MQQSITWEAHQFGGSAKRRARKEAAAQPTRAIAPTVGSDPGYVYLSVSRAMPGFVQVATCEEDPRDLTWSLQTMSGVSQFRNVFAVRTNDCGALAERFRQAVVFDQIPHHADFFKISQRFARNILEAEAKAFPSSEPMPTRTRRMPAALVAVFALALALPTALFSFSHQPAAQAATPKAPAPQVAVVPAAPVEAELPPAIVKPQFRISRM